MNQPYTYMYPLSFEGGRPVSQFPQLCSGDNRSKKKIKLQPLHPTKFKFSGIKFKMEASSLEP